MLHESNPHTRNTPHGSTTQQDVNSVVYTTEMNQVRFSAGGALNGICAIRKLGRPVTLCRSLEDTNFLNKPATASKESKSVSGEDGDACGLNGLAEGEDTTMDDGPEGHDGACEVEPRRLEGEGGTSSQDCHSRSEFRVSWWRCADPDSRRRMQTSSGRNSVSEPRKILLPKLRPM